MWLWSADFPICHHQLLCTATPLKWSIYLWPTPHRVPPHYIYNVFSTQRTLQLDTELGIFCLLEHLLICCYALSLGANGEHRKEIKKKQIARLLFVLLTTKYLEIYSSSLLFCFFILSFYATLLHNQETSGEKWRNSRPRFNLKLSISSLKSFHVHQILTIVLINLPLCSILSHFCPLLLCSVFPVSHSDVFSSTQLSPLSSSLPSSTRDHFSNFISCALFFCAPEF